MTDFFVLAAAFVLVAAAALQQMVERIVPNNRPVL
jgi:hypothetical protein